MPTSTLTHPSSPQEPKRLYRRLDQLLAPGEPRRSGSWLPDEFLSGLYGALRDDFGITGARLYAERAGRFVLHGGVGELTHDAAREIPLEALCDGRSLEESVRLVDGAGDPEAARALGITAPVGAGILCGFAPHRRWLALQRASGEISERHEFALHALHSALNAHGQGARARGTMREAAEIQRSLLLAAPPPYPGYDLACRSLPAEEVGGDFYDFLPLDNVLLGVAVGDASGHGLPAALLVRDLVTGLRMGSDPDLKAASLMQRLNRVIHRSNLSSRFASMFYAELEANGSMIYVNAGHPPPLLVLSERVQELSVGGTLLGPMPETRFARGFAHLDRGALLVLYTDGLIERTRASGQMFGVEGVLGTLRRHDGADAATLVAALIADSRDFGSGPWDDDVTVVVIRRLAEPERISPALGEAVRP
jgi:sigma-B regulation protein RsbU (phosphoserine phosphatase)